MKDNTGNNSHQTDNGRCKQLSSSKLVPSHPGLQGHKINSLLLLRYCLPVEHTCFSAATVASLSLSQRRDGRQSVSRAGRSVPASVELAARPRSAARRSAQLTTDQCLSVDGDNRKPTALRCRPTSGKRKIYRLRITFACR